MLSAVTRSGRKVYQLGLQPIKVEEPLFCSFCHAPVILRSGTKNRPHFAHCKKEACDYIFENESEEHLTLKSKLFETLSSCHDVEIEAHVKNNQIVDVLVNQDIALEVQCSQLPLKRLSQRNQGFKNQGIRVIWLAGKKLWLTSHITKLQDQLLNYSSKLGYYYWELDVENASIRIKYMIHEDLLNHVIYLTREWSLGEPNLYQILREPEEFIKETQIEVKKVPDYQTYIKRQLYFHNREWLNRQERLYLKGSHLLLEPPSYFWPFYRPLKPKYRFCLSIERQQMNYLNFVKYYKTIECGSSQILYPPSFF